jgi:hypothetical protein
MSYWDTSCLIKLYTPEPDSQIFRDFLDVGAACVTCDITPLEFWATVRRKVSEGVPLLARRGKFNALWKPTSPMA